MKLLWHDHSIQDAFEKLHKAIPEEASITPTQPPAKIDVNKNNVNSTCEQCKIRFKKLIVAKRAYWKKFVRWE